jgi:CRP-like cAMP-binding protein
LEGLASTSKIVSDGERQVVALHIAGDMPDLHSLHLERLDSDLRSVTACTVAYINHSNIRHLCDEYPRLDASLWRTTLIDASVLREWIANVGKRPGLSRMAHLFCELWVRMAVVGLNDGRRCPLSLTQSELGEATGLSVVHVNRMIQEIRKRKLAKHEDGILTITNMRGLMDLADFKIDYLHLPEEVVADLLKQ